MRAGQAPPRPGPRVVPGSRAAASHRRRQRRLAYLAALAFAAVLVAGTGLRLWHLGVSPAWQWDEAVYYRVAVNVQHGLLSEHSHYGVAWEPFLYQPPFYFLLLSRWFSVVGASIYHARLLGVILTAAMQAVLFRLLWKIHGPAVALFAIIPVIFDGWLLYIERVSYIENALMLLIVVGFLLYQRALERPSWHALRDRRCGHRVRRQLQADRRLRAAGRPAVLARHPPRPQGAPGPGRHRRGRPGGLPGGDGPAVRPGRPRLVHRPVDDPGAAGARAAAQRRHTDFGRRGVLHLLAAQYRFFVPSVLLALAAFLTVARRVLRCYLARSWEPAQGNALLFSWLVTGIVVFGLSSLKFPQYFALILIPAYCFLWTEVARWDWRPAWKRTAMAAATLAGLGSFLLTVPAFSANTLAEVQQYAAARIPAASIVVTEQSIGDLIEQPWCTVEARDTVQWATPPMRSPGAPTCSRASSRETRISAR